MASSSLASSTMVGSVWIPVPRFNTSDGRRSISKGRRPALKSCNPSTASFNTACASRRSHAATSWSRHDAMNATPDGDTANSFTRSVSNERARASGTPSPGSRTRFTSVMGSQRICHTRSSSSLRAIPAPTYRAGVTTDRPTKAVTWEFPAVVSLPNATPVNWGSVTSARQMLDERKAAILRAVVEEYIETAQPVGSGHVAPAVNVSSATVRNELATLEQEGDLHEHHTSAGRVPTETGYLYFADSLSGPATLGASQVQQVRSFFATAHGELEQMLHQTSRLLSDLTDHTAVVVGPPSEAATVRSVQLVGLGGNVALVVVVLSNGSIEKRTLELGEEHTEERLGAVTAHL